MEIWADLHTHTLYSHGKGTIKENVEAAIEKGLSTIGISDHGPANIFIGTKLTDFLKMCDEVEKLRCSFNNIEILLGCEANIISLDGQLDIPSHILKALDYVMVGLHPMIWTKSLKDFYHLIWENTLSWKWNNETLKKKVMFQNTKVLTEAIKNYRIKAITHPGLHLPIDTSWLAQEAAKYGTALEINAGHEHTTLDYIQIARKKGVKFIIGSDAHHPRDVGNFDKALDLVYKSGLTESDIINARPHKIEI